MAIISASRRTDLPASHGEWFVRRLKDGYCWVRLPYGGATRRVDLRPQMVEAFVFWTKNPTPFLPYLSRIEDLGYRSFVFQVTLTGLPSWMQPGVPDAESVLAGMRKLAERYGEQALVWRYDPIVITKELTPGKHLKRFEYFCEQLQGSTNEVITSVLDRYAKTDRNLIPELTRRGDELPDAKSERSQEVEHELLLELSSISKRFGIKLTLCCEPVHVGAQLEAAHCVDPVRIEAICGKKLQVASHPTRPGCGCFSSIDIGSYNTCPHGCLYCYANASPKSARHNAARIDPDNPALWPEAISPPQPELFD